jgi:hypothetical protein
MKKLWKASSKATAHFSASAIVEKQRVIHNPGLKMIRFGCCGKGCSNRPPLPDWIVGAVVIFVLLVMLAFLVILTKTVFS